MRRERRKGSGWDEGQVRDLVARLESDYGARLARPIYDPVSELVSCILTQHTADANAFPAFDRMRARFPTWPEVVAADPEELRDTIRAAGLANQKARSIQGALREIAVRNGDYTLENLRGMPMLEARKWLTSLPGVGPKTASIVLCFALGMPAIPVDTHIFRVSWRLGLIEKSLGEAKAHDALLDLVPPDLAFRFHVALIQHGRTVCKAPRPVCDRCQLTDLCAWYQAGNPSSLDAPAGRSARGSQKGPPHQPKA
ncbi:MAG: endonuclease III [Fimbriimonadaceae bacterium]|nr:Endonuclease III [Fimbriimonadaceae bacterium]MCC6351266.1 endonuclease III [Fimbriimonadaceae bacterium]MCL4284166.1 endonuclease III [Fimbriimonadaceae bacterium]QOJ10990.1 MAG: endonuclease III [Chthonomonadaceae bacterium]